MPNVRQLTAAYALLASIALFVGCAKEPAPAPAVPNASEPAASAPAATTEPESADEVAAAFAELPEADRALAIAQKICPVSGEPLGTMGAPIKVDVAGRAVFICCASCERPLLAEPDKFLAKLDAPAQ